MNVSKLLIKIIVNTLIAYALVWLFFLVPPTFFSNFTNGFREANYGEITIENGLVLSDGEIISETSAEVYSFNDKEFLKSYNDSIDEIVKSSKTINIAGGTSVFIQYLQAQPEILLAYTDEYNYEVNGLSEVTLFAESINRLFDINVVPVPVSAFGEDKGIESVEELVESGQVMLGLGVENELRQSEYNKFHSTKPLAKQKMYMVSLEDEVILDSKNDKIAIVDNIKSYNHAFFGTDNVVEVDIDTAIKMLQDGEVAHIIDSSSMDLGKYADEGLFISILDNTQLTGVMYLFATDPYSKELINFIDDSVTNETIAAIMKFGEKKYNYATLKYFMKSLRVDEFKNITDDGFIDVGYKQHIGMMYKHDEEKKFDGYTVDILRYISKVLGVSFRMHDYTYESNAKLNSDLRSGKLDVIADSAMPTSLSNIYTERKQEFVIPYMTHRFDIQQKVGRDTISNIEDLHYKTIGILVRDINAIEVFLEYKLREATDIDIKTYDTYAELERALKRDEVQYILTYPGYSSYMRDNVKLWSVDAYDENTFKGYNSIDFFLQVSESADDISERTVYFKRVITSMDTKRLAKKWFSNESIYDEILTQYNTLKILNAIIVLVVISILVSITTYLYHQGKTDKYLNEILFIDPVTKTKNRHAYNEQLESLGKAYCIKTRIVDYSLLKKSMSKKNLDILKELMASRIKIFIKDFEGIEVYYFSQDEFVIVVQYNDEFDYKYFMDNFLDVLKAVYVIKDRQLEVKVQLASILNEVIDYQNEKLIMYLNAALENDANENQNSIINLTPGMVQTLSMVELVESMLEKDFEKIIQPYYTPIYCTTSNNVIGLEVNSRLVDENVIISREFYYELAREIGYLAEIDEIVFLKTMRDRKQLIEENIIDEKFIFSYTLSETVLDKFVTDVKEFKRIVGVDDLSFIQAQVKEGVISQPVLTDKIKVCQKENIKIVVDNFRVGHSSLGKIIELNLDGVKIKYNLVEGKSAEINNKVFNSLVKMVKGIGIKIYVTDVEDERGFYYAVSDELEYLQGDYFMRPLPFEYTKKYLQWEDLGI